jgi:hypothetical protein
MLFGESEGLYKERYDYLMGRYEAVSHEVFEVGLKSVKICFTGDRYCERESELAKEQLPDLERDENALKDKLMDLKFKMQDELKTIPEWFKFKG